MSFTTTRHGKSADLGERTIDDATQREMIDKNSYIGRTDKLPRPTGEEPTFQWSGGQDDLAKARAKYDFAKKWDDDNVGRRAARIAKVDAEREADRQARRDEDEARHVDNLRAKYLRADPGASEEDFQRDLGEIRRQSRIAAALAEPAGRGTGLR